MRISDWSSDVCSSDLGQARRCKNFLALFHIGAFQAHNQRDRQVYFLCSRDDAIRDDVAAHDAAKDIDEDALDRRIGQNDLESGRDLFLGGAAANVQEVCGESAVQLDDVQIGRAPV